jgi:hypothetical protein
VDRAEIAAFETAEFVDAVNWMAESLGVNPKSNLVWRLPALANTLITPLASESESL